MKNGCDKCGTVDVFLRKKGNAVGLYCDGCGRWYKWVGKKDQNAFRARGYKIHDESYYPEHMLPEEPPAPKSSPPSKGVDNGYHMQTGSGKPLAIDPSLIVNTKDEDVSSDVPFAVPSMEDIRAGRLGVEPPKPKVEETKRDKPCQTCMSGVLESLSVTDDTSASIFEGVLSIHSKDNTKFYGAYKLNYCPECGKQLT